MIKPVLRMGDPLLLARSEPVTRFDTPELHALLQDLDDTMRSKNGAGIAAPLASRGNNDVPRHHLALASDLQLPQRAGRVLSHFSARHHFQSQLICLTKTSTSATPRIPLVRNAGPESMIP